MSHVIALTGGIGAGKSTVASLLQERGAVVFSADAFARRALDVGDIRDRVLQAVPVARAASGDVDRHALAEAIFADAHVRKQVESAMHPWIKEQMRASAESALAHGAAVVILEIPLLVESRTRGEIQQEFAAVITVEAPVEARIARLSQRGLTEADARARVLAQAQPQERTAVSDIVIDNSGSPGDLAPQVDRAWALIQDLGKNGAR